jgi:DNA helicase-2/ATP-dependent DNA helicase PcrA
MSEPIPDHLLRLNPQQYDAVTHTEGPLLILAGAGSGKTRVLTRRIAHLLLVKHIEPDALFAVTFTNKAASEMKERVIELVGEIGRKVWVSTFHSSCCRILRMEAEALGYTPRFAIYDDDDQIRLLKQIIDDCGYDRKIVVPKQVMSRIDGYKNGMITVEEAVTQRRSHVNDPVLRIWRSYEESLVASDAMDFNDLIGLAVKLFKEHPDILEKYREKFKYVMVDEYQDTNKAQYTLLQMLTSGHRNLAVVGDDDQSIYGFRGADISNILNFEVDYPDATIVRMEQNYRCTKNILALANAVVAKNEGRIVKRLWTDLDQGTKVEFKLSKDPYAEARWVAECCLNLRRRGIEYSDIAVIYRTNATSQPFEAAFRETHIAHKVVGGRKFYSRREIRDTLAYVRLITNPADDAAFLRVCNVPTRGVGTVTVQKIRDEAANRGTPLYKTAQSFGRGSGRGAKALGGFVEIIDGLTEISQTANLPGFLHEVLTRSGYAKTLTDEDSRESKARLENLNALLRDAANYEHDEELSGTEDPIHGWLDRIALTGKDEQLPDGGEVTLMTVHNSKGLEYPVVFVVNMVEGQFPHSRSAEEPNGVDEERRLVYVAFTRAQKRLIISRSRQELRYSGRTQTTEAKSAEPSRFLFGIPLEACQGDLPEDDPEVTEPSPAQRSGPGQRTDKVQSTKLHAFLAHQRMQQQAEPRPSPEGSYTTVEIESAEQLTRGTRVLHNRHGVGEIIRQVGATLHVKFDRGVKRIGLADGGLCLLHE